MIIVEVMGGLGNQMQQYALYRKLESLGKDARLDGSWLLDKERLMKVLARRKLELSWFENLPAKYCTQEEKQAILGKNNLIGKLKKKLLGGSNRHFTESDMYHPEIFDLEDAYLSGFWACEAYYADILPMLRWLSLRLCRNENVTEELLFPFLRGWACLAAQAARRCPTTRSRWTTICRTARTSTPTRRLTRALRFRTRTTSSAC